ncbi:MAG: NAD-dependent epimerase/dehydratase family protein [Deltaproteobacteria bacterium]|nr:NAD-dependent epimerase/dehydratase family protein [Deltaproteobacteria bacterium]
MLQDKRILLTGGAGFIGTHLAEVLCEDNDVVILDTLRRNALQPTGLDKHPRVTLIKGDVRDAETVRDAMHGCTHVIHLASIAGVDTVMQNPVPTMQISLLGTNNVLEAARAQGGIERVVDFSTSEVFGAHAYNVTEGDVTTLGAVGEARWTYAVSKLATEHLSFTFHKQYGLPTCAIRPFNIYGPRQVGEGAVHHFIVRALRGEPLSIHNDGGQIRAWCYIDDIIRGALLVLERPAAIGQTFNIGNPRSTVTIYNLAREIVRLARADVPIEFITWPFVDVELRIPDIAKARKLLGFEPQVDLDQGLLRTIDWYRERLAQDEAKTSESKATTPLRPLPKKDEPTEDAP